MCFCQFLNRLICQPEMAENRIMTEVLKNAHLFYYTKIKQAFIPVSTYLPQNFMLCLLVNLSKSWDPSDIYWRVSDWICASTHFNIFQNFQ